MYGDICFLNLFFKNNVLFIYLCICTVVASIIINIIISTVDLDIIINIMINVEINFKNLHVRALLKALVYLIYSLNKILRV